MMMMMMMMKASTPPSPSYFSSSSSSSPSSSSWRMLVSQYVALGNPKDFHQNNNNNDDENRMHSTWFPFDNTSNNCNNNNYWGTESSPDHTTACCSRLNLARSILRGMKQILIRVANSYYAMPLVLILIPLLTGIMMGVWWGRRWERRWEKSPLNKKRDKHTDPKSRRQSRISAMGRAFKSTILWLWNPVFLLLRVLLFGTFGRSSNDNPSKIETKSKDSIGPAAAEVAPSDGMSDKSLEVDEDHDNFLRAKLIREEECSVRESGVAMELVPKHVAVIMDGNRRYGRSKYQNATRGHRDGSEKLVEFAKWCCVEGVQVLTVYAFSTENWQRDPSEVSALMQLFCQYCDELRVEAIKRNIRLRVLSTDVEKIPAHVQAGLDRMESDTQHCQGGLTMNICLSYGSRGEMLNACKSLIRDVQNNQMNVDAIGEEDLQRHLLTNHCGDPDVLIRTSGEIRLSNFLLWQLAYTEFFFLPHTWPEVTKNDLLHVIRSYAQDRQRRFGK